MLTKDLDDNMQLEAVQAGQKLNPSRRAAVEKQAKDRPDDLVAHLKLLGSYWQREVNEGGASLSRFKLVLWLINNYPDFDCALQDYAELDQYPDRIWSVASSAWKQQIEVHKDNGKILSNAAAFHFKRDFSFAVSSLARAEVVEPHNGMYPYTLCTQAFAKMNREPSDELRRQLADIVLAEGQKAALCGFPFHQAAWTCCSHMAEAAFVLGDFNLAKEYAGKAPINDLYAEPAAQPFRDFMFAVIALKTGDPSPALLMLSQTESSILMSPCTFGLASELIQAGESVCVAEFLSHYLHTDVLPAEAACWLDDIKQGLVP